MFILYLIIVLKWFFFFLRKNVPLSAIRKVFFFLKFFIIEKIKNIQKYREASPSFANYQHRASQSCWYPPLSWLWSKFQTVYNFICKQVRVPPSASIRMCSVVSKIKFMFITDFVELQKLVHLHHIQLLCFWNTYLNIVLISKSNFIWAITSESSFI